MEPDNPKTDAILQNTDRILFSVSIAEFPIIRIQGEDKFLSVEDRHQAESIVYQRMAEFTPTYTLWVSIGMLPRQRLALVVADFESEAIRMAQETASLTAAEIAARYADAMDVRWWLEELDEDYNIHTVCAEYAFVMPWQYQN